MAKSKKSAQSRRASAEGRPYFVRNPLGAIDPQVMRKALSDCAVEQVAEFPKLVEQVRSLFKTASPLSILANTSVYGLQRPIREDGSSPIRASDEDTQQHHIELLQAIALTIPFGEWGREAAHPQQVQDSFDLAKALGNSFYQRRYAQIDQTIEPVEGRLQSIQERLRLNRQMVRNWGYYNTVISFSKEIYSPLDAKMREKLPVGPTEIIDLFSCLVKAVEERSQARW
jgi:hypothetical protein